VALLRRHLPARLRLRLAGTLSLPGYATDADVLRAAARAAEAAEHRAEQSLVDDLLDASPAAAVVGVDATLAALGSRQVHLLVVADTLPGTGGECPACARLFASGARCPACGGPLTEVGDLRDLAIRQAAEQGAKVEIVSGEATARLLEQGGLGAWTRY
jgi:peptide subunit release factor 1 (eRF1)